MHVYRVFNSDIERDELDYRFKGTLEESRVLAHSGPGPWSHDNVRIELIDVPTDKASIIKLLDMGELDADPLRTWGITKRGGLRELDNGE